jgi:hypothetical protein
LASKETPGKKAVKEVKAVKDLSITTVSFMIFRTGSVLIVGMCEENVLNVIYDFLTKLLKTEFGQICQSVFDEGHVILKDKKKKIRKKTIVIMVEHVKEEAKVVAKELEVEKVLVVEKVLEVATEVLAAELVEEFEIQCIPSKKAKKAKKDKDKNKKNKSALIM